MENKSEKQTSPRLNKLLLVILGILAAGILLLLSEAGLWLVDYGYPTRLFVRKPAGAKDYCVNYEAARRFFPGMMARKPLAERFAVDKKGAFRIFVLGESAARGESLSDFSFSRMLRVMLMATYPGREFEVINTGFPAINSWVIREFVHELAEYQPDLFIFYGGHNEVVGPYGPGTVFTSLNSRPAILLDLWLSGLKIFQAARSLTLPKNVIPTSAPASEAHGIAQAWKGLEMFQENRISYDDPRLRVCRDNFEKNVKDIMQTSLNAGARVVVCQVPVNRRDFAPFASLHREGLAAGQKVAWQQAFDQGKQRQRAGKWAEALDFYGAAAAIDASFAELSYCQGLCRLALNQLDQARKDFFDACEHDALHFRATWAMNEALASAVQSLGSPLGVSLVNLEERFCSESSDGSTKTAPSVADGIPGRELLYDHVHLTLKGHYLVAATLFELVTRNGFIDGKANLPPASNGTFLKAGPVPLTFSETLTRLGYTDRDGKQHLENVLAGVSQMPFTGRFDQEEYLAEMRSNLAKLASATTLEGLQIAIASYQTALSLGSGEQRIMNRLAGALAESGLSRGALAMYDQGELLNPTDIDLLNNRGLAYYRLNSLAEAARDFSRAIEVAPNFARAHFNLAVVYSRQKRVKEACQEYASALEIDPGMSQAHLNWGNILFREDRFSEAGGHYRAALAINPDSDEAHFSLGNVLHKQGDVGKGNAEYAEAIRLNPEFAPAHFSLGIALSKLNRFAEGEAGFLHALELEPHNPLYLDKAVQMLLTSPEPTCRNPELAVLCAEKAAEATGFSDPRILEILGNAYTAAGRPGDGERIRKLASKRPGAE